MSSEFRMGFFCGVMACAIVIKAWWFFSNLRASRKEGEKPWHDR